MIAMGGVLLSWAGEAHAGAPFKSVIEIKPRRKSRVELPLESKSSFIRRINSMMATVFGPSKVTKTMQKPQLLPRRWETGRNPCGIALGAVRRKTT